jgi:carbon-monoxide dehydrogenase small subunit
MKRSITIIVNGTPHEILVPAERTLLEVLREDLRLTGTKFGCEQAECGACTVLVDGKPALSCITLAQMCEGRSVTTVEGLDGAIAETLRTAFAEAGASQCGYCTPGMAVMFHHLLTRQAAGEAIDPKRELSGNICRCTGFVKILEAYEQSAHKIRKHGA